MKKLVTALMILLPLVFLVTLFTVTGITSITTQVAVTGIAITDKGDADGVFAFDIATYQPFNQSELGITVYPSEAKNKEYALTVTDVSTGAVSDVVALDEDGNFVLNDTGLVRLTYTTVDGGYTDSVLFAISSSGVLSFEPTMTDAYGEQVALNRDGEVYTTANLSCGTYNLGTLLYPQATIAEKVTFACDEPGVKVNALTGEVTTYLGGSYTVDVTVKGIKGDITHQVVLNTRAQVADLAINGYANLSALSVAEGSTTTTIYLESQDALSPADIAAAGDYIQDFEVTALDDHRFAVTLTFADGHPANTSYTLTAGAATRNLSVQFVERTFYVYAQTNSQGLGEIVMLADSTMTLAADTDGQNWQYDWTLLSQQGEELSTGSGSVFDVSLAETGRYVLSINAYLPDEEDEDSVLESHDLSRALIVTPRYTTLLFAESSQDTALSDVLAYPNKVFDADGNLVDQLFRPTLKDGTTVLDNWTDLVWSTSADSLATVRVGAQGAEVSIHATGKVTLTASWRYATVFGVDEEKARATYTFIAVDGVKVTNSTELQSAVDRNLAFVLAEDIHLGEDLFNHSTEVVSGIETTIRTPKYDKATMAAYLESWTHTIPTTWDWTYYKNNGYEHPDVRYILEFNANVYGNGHYISCEYITDMLDSTGNLYDFAVFRGPLNFVAANDPKNGISVAAVKGQDNICFLVRQDDITLENVVLKGCDDEALYIPDEQGNPQIDLTRLNYVGTTLEIMSNVDLHACRVQNGRTVVRAYGRDGINLSAGVVPLTERIRVSIDSCVLSNAREFILKLSTNRYLLGTKETPSPALTDASGKAYTQHNKSQCDALVNNEYFYSRYVLTDVTVRDSTLATSGLFTVGMESHFAGAMLTGNTTIGKSYMSGWYDLAATNYSAVLRLVGDVKLSDWKNIANVDSSTLIETAGNLADSMSFLNLDVGAMLTAVKENGGEAYRNVIKEVDGRVMAHGGIAMYGGGRNYHIVDTSEWAYAEYAATYNVNLNILANSSDPDLYAQGTLLPSAAGPYDFRFIMYDANSYEQTINQ